MIQNYFTELWDYIVITAPYLIFGLLASGVLHQFLSLSSFKGFLKGEGTVPVLKAALVGVPLPLCSCSVIPAAVTLRKDGASKGATSSFLISTPESGVDSMLVTYALLDLPMTIIRPLAALITAFVAGVAQNLFNTHEADPAAEVKSSCCSHSHSHAPTKKTFMDHIKGSVDYAFNDSSDDLAFWLLIGLMLGALVNVAVPEEFFYQSNGFWGRVVLLLVGIPFYICASSSTPIAASMMMKGMSPGCALIFLLAGPATNFTNMAVLQAHIGKKGVLINVIVIALVSLGLSYLVDAVYTSFGWSMMMNSSGHESHEDMYVSQFAGVALVVLMFKGIYKEKLAKYFSKSKKSGCCS